MQAFVIMKAMIHLKHKLIFDSWKPICFAFNAVNYITQNNNNI